MEYKLANQSFGTGSRDSLPFPFLNSLLYFYNLFASGTLPLIEFNFADISP
jgi:hypothetical protein